MLHIFSRSSKLQGWLTKQVTIWEPQSQLNRTSFFRIERTKARGYFSNTNFHHSANRPYNRAHSTQAVAPHLPKAPSYCYWGKNRLLFRGNIKQGTLSSPGVQLYLPYKIESKALTLDIWQLPINFLTHILIPGYCKKKGERHTMRN